MNHLDPDGVSIEESADTPLRTDKDWLVVDRGELKQLRLRVGRGTLRPATDEQKLGIHIREEADNVE